MVSKGQQATLPLTTFSCDQGKQVGQTPSKPLGGS
jgi:hypothetical protein